LASATLELPQFKGRPGWEFTTLPGDFALESFPHAGGSLDAAFTRVLSAPPGATELLQVNDAVGEGVVIEDGPVVMPLRAALERHPELVEPHLGTLVPGADLFTLTNESEWEGGAFVYVPAGVHVENPILLTAVLGAAGARMDRRVLISLGSGSSAEVWEQWVSAEGAERAVINAATEIVVGQGSQLKYVTAQNLNESSFVFATQRAEVARDASLTWAALGFGSANGRIGMYTRLSGPGAQARVTGAYATRGRQHIDYDTTQEHGAEHCFSDLAFRGIVGDRSSAVWKGNIIVDPGAQKTDAFQECRNLLLGKRAHADAIPGLEILANDVRCTHAAAVAQIDIEQLFYLQSRGMSPEVAQRLVVEGFLSALVERFEAGSALRTAVADALEQRLVDVLG
jgi:Fe-S cluster assembly protein SufD